VNHYASAKPASAGHHVGAKDWYETGQYCGDPVSRRRLGMNQIRNPKPEIRNKFEIQKEKDRGVHGKVTDKDKIMHRTSEKAGRF
jgi:hypothetical protein